MKTYFRIVLLTAVLGIFVCFGYLSFAQKRSAGNAAPPTSQGTDIQLFLNGTPAGSTSNLVPLKTGIKKIFDSRRQKSPPLANLADGALPITDRVILVPDGTMSMLQFGSVAKTVEDSLDYDSYRKLVLFVGSGCQGNSNNDPANIILSNAAPTGTGLGSAPCWLELSAPASSPRLAKRYRIAVTSLEIKADGTYAINDQLQKLPPLASPNANWSVSSNRLVDAAKVNQRAVDQASFETEVRAWVDRRKTENNKEWEKIDADMAKELGPNEVVDHGPIELPIIVNAKAPYSSVKPILRLLPRNKVTLTFVVDNSAP
jgi:hypothetical protein